MARETTEDTHYTSIITLPLSLKQVLISYQLVEYNVSTNELLKESWS